MRLSMRYQIWLIALLPMLILVFAGNFYYINNSFKQAQNQLEEKGQIITDQLAVASEYALIGQNQAQLENLLNRVRMHPEVTSAAIYNEAGTLLSKKQDQDFERAAGVYFSYHQDVYSSADPNDPYSHSDNSRILLGSVHVFLSQNSLLNYRKTLIFTALVSSLGLFSLTWLLIFFITQRFLEPLKQLLNHLQLVEAGQLDQTIQPLAKNEMGLLQIGFNKMTQSLYANRLQLDQQIRQATVELMSAVGDLEIKNTQLEKARKEAVDASHIKSAFLANMSHELRTPLNGIQGFIRLLEHTQLQPEQLRYIEILKQTTKDLYHLISEILDFSAIESGKLKVYYSTFNLYQTLEEVRSLLYANTLDKPVRLYLLLYSDTPQYVVGDEHRIKQILVNLVGNAIKFTDEGHVCIRVMKADEDGQIQFQISDTGIGISAADQAQLFQAFHQVDSGNNRHYQGTGLGLVITKRIIETLKGNLTLQSELERGTQFSFQLPLPADPQQEGYPESDRSIMLLSTEELARQELNSLFQRTGFYTESQLCSLEEILEMQWNKSWETFDWLVLDLRKLDKVEEQKVALIGQSMVPLLCMVDNSAECQLSDSCFQLPGLTPTNEIREFLLDPYRSIERAKDEWEVQNKSLHLLVVDDNPVNLAYASELLQKWGHDVKAAAHAREALELFDANRFDCLLLDIQMPDIDGVELMQEIRRRDPQLDCPVVALTANAQTEERDRLLDLGFDFYLSKPIDEPSLNRVLRHSAHNTIETDIINPDIDTEAQNPKEMLDIFNREIPDYLSVLQSAQRHDQNQNPIADLIHTLKGSCCYLNLPKLKDLLEGLPSHYTKLNQEQQIQFCDALEMELRRIQQIIEKGADSLVTS